MKGFPIGEAVSGLLVLGIAGCLIVPRLIGHADGGPDKSRSDISELCSALEHFKSDVGHYPSTQEGLHALVVMPAGAKGWTEQYIEVLPADAWQHDYAYKLDPGGKTFEVRCFGKDGTPNTDDDVTNNPAGYSN